MTLLIQNGTVVNTDSNKIADVLCKDGKIIKIEKDLIPDSTPDKIIDASNCYVIPGGIDPHVHMHLPSPAGFSSDDFGSGSRAAIYGGTTTLIDFVTPKKGQALNDAISQRKSEAANCLTNYAFHVSPVEWRDSMEDEIRNCVNKEGFKSFKVYMAYKDSIGLNDDVLMKVMKAVSKAGGMVTVHCELGDDIEELRTQFASDNKLSPKYHSLSRPAELEAKAVKKAIELAKVANCPLYIVHVSTKASLKYISEAQENGQVVMAESCPQYLLLDDSKYNGVFNQVAPFVMSPPLRKPSDNAALWEAISNRTVLTVGTDHCPFTQEQKEMGKDDFRKIPNGAGGVEHRLALLFTYGVLGGRISMEQFVSITSTNASKIFGMFPAKGIIAEGSDADIVIWNPGKENTISVKTHHQNCDMNIYEGIKTKGTPEYVILDGKVVLEKNRLSQDIRKGSLLKTKPF
ncbi:MAG: dihydropyrimidinase [Bacteroidetes bacterium]|nr:MAG: dihydropyrimidinase [Bacteroidota bacterium]